MVVRRVRRNPSGKYTRMAEAIGELSKAGVRLPLRLAMALMAVVDDEQIDDWTRGWYDYAGAEMWRALAAMPERERDEYGPKAFELLADAVEDQTRRRYTHPSRDGAVAVVFAVFGKALGTFGVEKLVDDRGQRVASYLNAGDTYDATLLYDAYEREWQWTSWGDFVEQSEASGRYTFA